MEAGLLGREGVFLEAFVLEPVSVGVLSLDVPVFSLLVEVLLGELPGPFRLLPHLLPRLERLEDVHLLPAGREAGQQPLFPLCLLNRVRPVGEDAHQARIVPLVEELPHLLLLGLQQRKSEATTRSELTS